jgi:hypothetical protein
MSRDSMDNMVREQSLEDIERLHFRARTTVVRNAATTTVARLDASDWWRKPAAAEGATGAIDLSEEHHNIVRISAGTVKRLD